MTCLVLASTAASSSSRDVTTPSRDVTTPTRDVTNTTRNVTNTTRDVTAPSREVTTPSHDFLCSSRDVTTAGPRDVINGLTISLINDDSVHPLQIKRKIKQRRHSMYTSLAEFTSQGFVPFLPEGLMKKDTTPDHLIRRLSPAANSATNSPDLVRRKRFSDADIDQLSFLYSNNFDPSKSPQSNKKGQSKPGGELAGRLGVREISVLREEEGETSIRCSRSDSDLFTNKGRRYSTVN